MGLDMTSDTPSVTFVVTFVVTSVVTSAVTSAVTSIVTFVTSVACVERGFVEVLVCSETPALSFHRVSSLRVSASWRSLPPDTFSVCNAVFLLLFLSDQEPQSTVIHNPPEGNKV